MKTRNTVLIVLALILIVAGGWTYLAFQRDLSAGRDRLASVSRIVETRSGPIEYAETGSGPVLLVVHGAGGGFDQGLDLSQPFSRGYRVIAVSRFGYLRTPLPADASVAAQADAHAALLDALHIETAAIMGISAGGPSALQFAISHAQRCKALILMVPLAYRPPDIAPTVPKLSPGEEQALMTLVGSDFIYWLATKLKPSLLYGSVLGTPPEVIAAASPADRMRVDRVMSNILPISERLPGILNDSTMANSLAPFELDKVTASTLVISARDDLYGTYANSEYTAGKITGARFVGYTTGGHMLAGRYDQVAAEIAAFLKMAGHAPVP